jgi:1,2-diacylglycerol-3-alpha-glucose alpha-1,2-glucosyltransferase
MRIIFIEEIALIKKLWKKETMGGIETNTNDVISELRGKGHEVIVNGEFPDGSRPDVIAGSTYGPISQYKLYTLKQKYKCACVQHAHTTAQDLRGGFLPDNAILNNYLIPFYIKRLYNHGHILITPTEYSKQCLEENGVRRIIHVVSNGIKLEKFHPDPKIDYKSRFKDYLEENFDVDKGTPIIVNCGYTWKRKGIDSFYRVAKQMKDYAFVWVGPIVESEYTKAAKDVKNIFFTGFYPDILDAYYGSDIFFFPSYVENQGIPLMEAGYCKLPIVTRDIPAFNWLPNGTHCLKANSDQGFIDNIEYILTNRSKLNSMLDNARELTIDLHDFNKIGQKLESLYYQAEVMRQIYLDKYGQL